MDNEPTQSERKKTWLTEGILIASVPVSVYILMLSFVIGYCDFFRIPVSFASLNLPTMLWIGLRLEFGLYFMITVTAFAYVLLRSYANTAHQSKSHPEGWLFGRVILILIVTCESSITPIQSNRH